jgi:dynactin complex subunit
MSRVGAMCFGTSFFIKDNQVQDIDLYIDAKRNQLRVAKTNRSQPRMITEELQRNKDQIKKLTERNILLEYNLEHLHETVDTTTAELQALLKRKRDEDPKMVKLLKLMEQYKHENQEPSLDGATT